MTVEEKIKEVYGKSFEKLKDFICIYSGVCSDRQYNKINCPFPSEVGFEGDVISWYSREDDGERMVDVYNWIPEELHGIEDNNGWVRIESEDDLPEEGHYWVIYINGELSECPKSSKLFEDNEYWMQKITHYQPIEKPKPPII